MIMDVSLACVGIIWIAKERARKWMMGVFAMRKGNVLIA